MAEVATSPFLLHSSSHVTRKEAWELLFDLTSCTQASFAAAQVIRSTRFTDDEVYALIKLTHALDQPARGRTLGILRSACKFRQMTWPTCSSSSLRLPFLAHASCQRNVETWLRQHAILPFKHVLIPFHLPSHRLREQAHDNVAELLFNFRWWEDKLDHSMPAPCTCQELISRFPSLADYRAGPENHVVAGFHQLNTHEHGFSVTLGSNSCFPSKSRFFDTVLPHFEKWRKRHCIPNQVSPQFRQLLEEQWHLHAQEKQLPRTSWRTVQRIKHLLQHVSVLHCEDHAPKRVVLFCPRLYFCTARRTWSDPSVFQSLPGTIQSWQHTVSRLVGANLRKRYAWGIRSSSPLPRGLTLLKRKKSFQVARTIISYKNSIIERLLKAAAQVLQMMIATVWPHALGLLSLPQVWQQLHSFLETTDVTVHLCEANDDLWNRFSVLRLIFSSSAGTKSLRSTLMPSLTMRRRLLVDTEQEPVVTSNTSSSMTLNPSCRLPSTQAFSGLAARFDAKLMARQSETKSVQS